MPNADIADEPDGLDGLRHRVATHRSRSVSVPRPLSFDAFGSRVANRKPMAGRLSVSDTRRIFVAMTMSSTSWVLSPVAVTSDDSGAMALADAEVVVEPAVDLQLRNGTEAEAEAEGRDPPQVALQPGHRIELIVGEVEPAFDQDAAGADGSGSSVTSGRCCAAAGCAEGQNQRGGQSVATASSRRICMGSYAVAGTLARSSAGGLSRVSSR